MTNYKTQIAQANKKLLLNLATFLNQNLFLERDIKEARQKWEDINFLNADFAALVNFETFTADVINKVDRALYRSVMRACILKTIKELEAEALR